MARLDTPVYSEIAPSPQFADSIECFWTMSTGADVRSHRVVPDGCADILFSQHDDGAVSVELVGAMSCYADFAVPPGGTLFGVRFRPGRWRTYVGVSGAQITDCVLPFDQLRGELAREIGERLVAATSLQERAAAMESILPLQMDTTPMQRAIAWMEQQHGWVSLDDIALQANFSTRQFRRACLRETGLSPKLLSRILRFRHAVSLLGQARTGVADVALACGYFDQAHLTNELRLLSGYTPRIYRSAAA